MQDSDRMRNVEFGMRNIRANTWATRRSPFNSAFRIRHSALEWALQDLNLGPTDYESAALTAELRARTNAECRMRSAELPGKIARATAPTSLFRIRHSALGSFRIPHSALEKPPSPEPPQLIVFRLMRREHFGGRYRRDPCFADLDARGVVGQLGRFPHRGARRQRRSHPCRHRVAR